MQSFTEVIKHCRVKRDRLFRWLKVTEVLVDFFLQPPDPFSYREVRRQLELVHRYLYLSKPHRNLGAVVESGYFLQLIF
jgi:hypothetical protein